mgnify:CR=1 FL=1
MVTMEDPDETTTPANPIKVCGVVFRIRYAQFAMRELSLICTILMSLVCIVSVCLVYLRTPVLYGRINIRWLTVTASVSVASQHLFSYWNLIMAGCGSSNGRFWCDVKIMIVRGFNTIRTVSRLVSSPLLFMQMALLLGCLSAQALLFLCIIIVLSELQLGLSENQNQYDVQTQDKFIDDNKLLMEQVHKYQQEHPYNNVRLQSFVVYAVLNVLVSTILLLCHNAVPESMTFAMPIVTILLLYCSGVPILTHLLYLKGVWTFCEYEIYRSLADVLFLTLLTLFTFV